MLSWLHYRTILGLISDIMYGWELFLHEWDDA